jgi:hypothetical protein
MCPVCVATIAMVTAGATSTGGVTALVLRKLRIKSRAQKAEEKGADHGRTENRLAR